MSEVNWPRDNAELVDQLVRQRDRYEQLVNNMSDLLLLIEPDGTVSFSNRRGELPPGGTTYPAVGTAALDYIVERDRQAVGEAMRQVLNRQVNAHSVLFHIRDGRGGERTIEGTVTRVLEEGKVVQLEFLGRDVTERQQASEALRQVNAALKRRQEELQRDLDVAAKIHASLLPPPLQTQQILIDLKHEPLLGVGGDYVYIQRQDPLRPAVVVFDVTGHGVASALVANRVHSAVHAIMSQGSPPPEMIGRLNHFIYDSFADLGIFVTLLAMQFDLANGQACYCGAGHPPALLHRRNGDDMVALESAHLPIGVADNIFIGEPMRTVPLGPGDAVWLYTDGLMELRDARGEILGVHGLSQRLKSLDTSVPHPGLAERALAALLADFESPDDDITLVAAIVK